MKMEKLSELTVRGSMSYASGPNNGSPPDVLTMGGRIDWLGARYVSPEEATYTFEALKVFTPAKPKLEVLKTGRRLIRLGE